MSERDEFEAWAKGRFYLDRIGGESEQADEYAEDATHAAWAAWQGARATPDTETKEPEHAHDWRFSLQDHMYKCDCGATRGDYPFGAASFKD